MLKEFMTSKQTISVIVLFIFGSTLLMGISTDAYQDSWISLLIAITISLPLVLMYARIIKLNPGENIYDIAEKLFGKVIGKIIIILMTWYAIHLGALVLRNFSEYIEISSLINTPQIIVMILLLSITTYIAKSGAGIFGKWAIIILPFVLLMIMITLILSITDIDINNIFPIMGHSIKKISIGALKSFTFPFAETVLMLALACFFKKDDSSYKIYISGILLGGLSLLIILLRNLTVLGAPMMASSYFPSFAAARVIEIGDFITRIEGIITINFIFAGVTKITVCLIATSKGMAKLFAIKNYKDLVFPSAFLILALCAILYTNVIEMFAFINIYGIYAIPFQIIIPMIIWIASEKKARNKLSLS